MRVYFFLIAVWISVQGLGQPYVWKGKKQAVAIGLFTSVLEDSNGKLSITEIGDSSYRSRFHSVNRTSLHFGFTNSIYWLRFELKNYTGDSLYLQLDQAFLPNVDLFYKDINGQWTKTTSGYGIGLENKPVIDHSQLFPLAFGAHTYFVRLQPYVHAIPIQLMEKNFAQIRSATEKITYGIYAGLLLFAVIINFFLFVALKKLYFLNYSILVFFYLLTSALVMEGYAVYFFPDIDLMFWYRVIPVADMPAFLFYCISFFELKKNYPQIYRVALCGALFFCVWLLLLPLLPTLPVLLINQVFALLVFLFGIHTGLTIGRSGNKLGYLFAAFYSLWFLLILIEAIYIQTGFPAHFYSLSYVSTAIFIEAFLLAFLQVKRFQWEKKDDQLKQFEMKRHIDNMEQNFQREMLHTKLEIQEQTFNMISEEIHDNVGQLLSLAKIQINIIEQKEGKDKLTLKELKENIGQAMCDLRLIAKNLSSHYIQNTSLPEAVTNQVQRINRLGLVNISLSVSGTEQKLENQKKLVLYRIIQEGLQNIMKHSKASKVNIRFDYSNTILQVFISDNGTGFDQLASIENNDGLGLKNVTSRAEMIGGKAIINSNPNQGTTIEILTPYV